MPRHRTHNYHPSWDYTLDHCPDLRVRNLIRIFNRRHQSILHALHLPKPKIYFILDLADNHLARFISGTSSAPVIVLDANTLTKSATWHGVSLETAIETTLLHEYGHAYLESTGNTPKDEEEIVEQFAHHFWKTGDIEGSVAILDGISDSE